jgi:hypothetical protein
MAKDMTETGSPNGATTRSGASEARTRADDARDAARAATTQVGAAMDGVREAIPEVVRASRGVMDDAIHWAETSSEQRVTAGVTMSLGLALGMLLGGAPRFLIALALVPVAAMGLVLMDRRSGRPTTRANA